MPSVQKKCKQARVKAGGPKLTPSLTDKERSNEALIDETLPVMSVGDGPDFSSSR